MNADDKFLTSDAVRSLTSLPQLPKGSPNTSVPCVPAAAGGTAFAVPSAWCRSPPSDSGGKRSARGSSPVHSAAYGSASSSTSNLALPSTVLPGMGRSKTLTEGLLSEHEQGGSPPHHPFLLTPPVLPVPAAAGKDAAPSEVQSSAIGAGDRTGSPELVCSHTGAAAPVDSGGSHSSPTRGGAPLSFKDRQRSGGRYGSGSLRGSTGSSAGGQASSPQRHAPSSQDADSGKVVSSCNESQAAPPAASATPSPRVETGDNAVALRGEAAISGNHTKASLDQTDSNSPPVLSMTRGEARSGDTEGSTNVLPPSTSPVKLSFKERLRGTGTSSGSGGAGGSPGGGVLKRRSGASPSFAARQPQPHTEALVPSQSSLATSPPTSSPPATRLSGGGGLMPSPPTHTFYSAGARSPHRHSPRLQPAAPHELHVPSASNVAATQHLLQGSEETSVTSPQLPQERTETLVYGDSKGPSGLSTPLPHGAPRSGGDSGTAERSFMQEGADTPPLGFRRRGTQTASTVGGAGDMSCSAVDALGHSQSNPTLHVCEEGEPGPVALSMAIPKPRDLDPTHVQSPATEAAKASPQVKWSDVALPVAAQVRGDVTMGSGSNLSATGPGAPFIGHTQTFASPTKANAQPPAGPRPQPHNSPTNSSPLHKRHRQAQKDSADHASLLARTTGSTTLGRGSGGNTSASVAHPTVTAAGGSRKDRGKMLSRALGAQPSLTLSSTVTATASSGGAEPPLKRYHALSGGGVTAISTDSTLPSATAALSRNGSGTNVASSRDVTPVTGFVSTTVTTPEPVSLTALPYTLCATSDGSLVQGDLTGRSPAEQAAHDFMQRLQQQQQQQDDEEAGSSCRLNSGGEEEGEAGRGCGGNTAGQAGAPRRSRTTSRDDTDKYAEAHMERSMDSQERALGCTGGGSSNSELLSGTHASFAATRDNRRTSTFSSLQFSMKRRMRGKANERLRKAAASAATKASSAATRKAERGSAAADDADGPDPLALTKGGIEGEGEGTGGAVASHEASSLLLDEDDDDDGVESAQETKGSSRGSDERLEDTGAFLAEMEEDEAVLQKRVGMWETAEHVFIPTYESLEKEEHLEEVVSRGAREAGSGSPVSASESHGSGDDPKVALAAVGNLSPQFLSPVSSPKYSGIGSGFIGGGAGVHGNTALTTGGGVTSGSASSQSASGYPSMAASPPGMPAFTVCSPKLEKSDSARRPEVPGEGNQTKAGEEVRGGAAFAFGSIAPNYYVEPSEDDPTVDCKVAARLLFDPDHGTMLLAPQDEVERYGYAASMTYNRTHPAPASASASGIVIADDAVELNASASVSSSAKRKMGEDGSATRGEDDEGACGCDENFISKDSRGMDYSKYNAHTLYDHCICCQRRPGCFLCLHCFKSVCPTHVQRHYRRNPLKCTLYLNILDIMTSFDRIFWCEKCKQFTWKYTEIYDPLVDQIAYTRGTYFPRAVRDIHCFGVQTVLQEESSARGAFSPLPSSPFSVGGVVMDEMMAHPTASSWAASLSNPTAGVSAVPLLCSANLGAAFSPCASAASPPAQAHFNRSAVSGVPTRSLFSGFTSTNTTTNVAGSVPVGGSADGAGAAVPAPNLSASPPLIGTVAMNNASSLSFGMPLTVNGGAASSASLMGHPCVASPMADMLRRDTAALTEGSVLPVGNAVSKLSAIVASVQGWRATQEDAEAAFLVYIPALRAEKAPLASVMATAQRQDAAGATPLLTTSGERPGGEEAAAEEDEGAADKIPMAVFCVFDGHGGDAVAKLAAGHFESHLRRAIARARPDDIRARALLFHVQTESTFSPRQRGLANASNPASLANSMTSPMASITGMATPHTLLHGQARPPLLAGSLRGGGSAVVPPLLSTAGSHDTASHPQQQQRLSMTAMGSSGSAAGAGGYRFAGPLLVPGASMSSGHPHRSSSNSSPRLDSLGDSSPHRFLGVPVAGAGGEEEESIEEGDSVRIPGYVPTILAPVTAASLAQHVSATEAQNAFLAGGDDAAGIGGSKAAGSSTKANAADALNVQKPASTSSRSPKLQAQDMKHQQQQQRSSTLVRQWEQESLSAIAGGSCTNLSFGAPRPLSKPASSTNLPSAAPPLDVRRGSGGHCLNPALALSPAAVVAVSEVEMLRNYFASIMEEALLSLDDYLQHTEEGVRGDYNCVGCTACIVGITPNFILCANVGDSGACFYNQETIESISVKHRLSDPKEQARISAAGYSINNNRIEGMLAVPRALGDFDFKQCGGKSAKEQAVTAVPDVTIRPTPTTTTAMVATAAAVTGTSGVEGDTTEDRWGILLACDGVWDTATLHQIHHALVNTPNDLDVASSAMEASLRAKELARHHRRGPVHYLDDTPAKGGYGSTQSSPVSAQGPSMPVTGVSTATGPSTTAATGIGLRDKRMSNEAERLKEEGAGSASAEPRADLSDGEESYVEDVGGDPQATDGIDPRLLTAAAGVFAQCIAPADNEEGVGLDNCSLILIERRA